MDLRTRESVGLLRVFLDAFIVVLHIVVLSITYLTLTLKKPTRLVYLHI